MFNLPQKFVYGDYTPHTINPMVLKADMFRYHRDVTGIPADQRGDAVIMFTTGTKVFRSVAGEHDGIRDGENAVVINTSQNYTVYCSVAEWLAAGNEVPA